MSSCSCSCSFFLSFFLYLLIYLSSYYFSFYCKKVGGGGGGGGKAPPAPPCTRALLSEAEKISGRGKTQNVFFIPFVELFSRNFRLKNF